MYSHYILLVSTMEDELANLPLQAKYSPSTCIQIWLKQQALKVEKCCFDYPFKKMFNYNIDLLFPKKNSIFVPQKGNTLNFVPQ